MKYFVEEFKWVDHRGQNKSAYTSSPFDESIHMKLGDKVISNNFLDLIQRHGDSTYTSKIVEK